MQDTSQNTKRILLAGNYGAGKSSIHCVLFGDYPKYVNFESHQSLNYEQYDTKFLNDYSVRIWELNAYQMTEEQKEAFLKDIVAVVYVINVSSERLEEDLKSLQLGLELLHAKYAASLKVFVLIHQCDRIEQDKRVEAIEKCKDEILQVEKNGGFSIEKIFATSVWDDTFYRAWSEISQGLTEKREIINDTLKYLADTCCYDEVVLFDKKTFLILDCYEKEVKDKIEKYEILGTIIKNFKITCKKGTDMNSLLISNSKFTAYISVFTASTYIMAITFDPKTQPGAIELNVKEAKKYYEKKVGQVV